VAFERSAKISVWKVVCRALLYALNEVKGIFLFLAGKALLLKKKCNIPDPAAFFGFNATQMVNRS